MVCISTDVPLPAHHDADVLPAGADHAHLLPMRVRREREAGREEHVRVAARARVDALEDDAGERVEARALLRE
jgi:hypothetical protein